MKNVRTILIRAFAAAMVIALVMVNIQVETQPPFSVDDIRISVNEADAKIYLDMRLEEECWTVDRSFTRNPYSKFSSK